MRCLILAPELPWPLHGGRQINAHHLMRCLVERGHEVLLLLRHAPDPTLWKQWPLAGRVAVVPMAMPAMSRTLHSSSLDTSTPATPGPIKASLRRWRRYLGAPEYLATQTARIARDFAPDLVEGCGLDTPLWMTHLPAGLPRLWLAADEKLLFHLTSLRQTPGLRPRLATLRQGLAMALYERCAARLVDGVVTVARRDGRWMHRVIGHDRVLVCPNGVDDDYFHPTDAAPQVHTAAFWGRLDFAPNVEAVTWFAQAVWPQVRRLHPDAHWFVIGRAPGAELRALAGATPGMELIADPPDIRPWAWRAAAAVFPVRGGSGVKNKLLEAAAMGRAIVASPAAVRGCAAAAHPPWLLARHPGQWVGRLTELWAQPTAARALGQAARTWVREQHDWRQGIRQRELWLQHHPDRPWGVNHDQLPTPAAA